MTPPPPALPDADTSALSLRGLWARVRGADLQDLPSHVQRALERQRQGNEILAGWVQMALVLVFAVFYSLSRKTFPPDTMLHPVPWALGVYGAFTMLRLLLAYRNRLGHRMLMVSVVVDISVLMVTIWSFHIQYGQVAAFYLKAPTLLYVFIFIALRALSLSPVYVLFAGACAAVGWLILVALAIRAPGGVELITDDYVKYMTSLHILIGGEMDKVIAIVVVTLLLAIAARRAQSLLHRSVAGQAAADQLSRFFAPDVAASIVSSNEILQPGQGRQTEAAAMFIDLRGFTRMAATLSPSNLLALLAEYQRIVVPIVQRNGGSIITFLGDGVMITFGATRPSSTYAADAMRTAEQLIDGLGVWAETRRRSQLLAPAVGIGMASGGVTYGAIGHEGRLEYAVIGLPVNLAAKLETHTKVEQVTALATTAMLELARAQGYDARRAAEVRLARRCAGVAEPIDLVVVH
jgi:adenylate cyclase